MGVGGFVDELHEPVVIGLGPEEGGAHSGAEFFLDVLGQLMLILSGGGGKTDDAAQGGYIVVPLVVVIPKVGFQFKNGIDPVELLFGSSTGGLVHYQF